MLHKFEMGGDRFVLDVESGAVHMTDALVYEMLGDYEALSPGEAKYAGYGEDEIREAYDEITELKAAGALFTRSDFEKYLPEATAGQTVVKALCLHVAHDCNFKCKYCFAGEGEYHGGRSLMSAEVGRAALDFILQNSGGRKNLEVDFFGGEPLMNFSVVKDLVEYGRRREKEFGKAFRFTITTNGLLLDSEKERYINENMDNVVLSLDGRKEINDRMRPLMNGAGSYDRIAGKIKETADLRGERDHYVRGTYTRHNLDFSKDVLHMADLGFRHISVEPVVAGPEADYSLREADLPALFEEYEKLAMEMDNRRKEGRGFDFFHFNIDLSGGPCVIKRLRGCGAGSEYLAVTPEGDLYPCHQFVGMPEFKMGTVFAGVQNAPLREEFARTNIYSKEKCKECWAKYYCSGGCAANAYQYGGSINAPYGIGCELLKKRVECAIFLKSRKELT